MVSQGFRANNCGLVPPCFLGFDPIREQGPGKSWSDSYAS